MKKDSGKKSPESLPTWGKGGTLNVLVDTPRGSAVKYKVDLEKNVYTVSHFLTRGAVFPWRARAATPCPCARRLVTVRLVGGLEARQTQEGKTMRNDRLLGVAAESHAYDDVHNMRDVPKRLLDEIEHFFVSYNEARGRRFRVLRRVGPEAAKRLVKASQRLFESKRGET